MPSTLNISKCVFNFFYRDSKFEVEPRPPSRTVSLIFTFIYSVLGIAMVVMIVLTVLYNFSLLLLLSMMAVIFIALIIVTNFCVIVYQY